MTEYTNSTTRMQWVATARPAQGELFTVRALPRQFPVYKALPEEEQLPAWAHSLKPDDTRH